MLIKSAHRSTRLLTLFCLVVVLLAGCGSPASTAPAQPTPTLTALPIAPSTTPLATLAHLTLTAAPRAEWPTAAWQTSSPEAQGLNSQQLVEALKAIDQRHLNLHSLLIIRNGYLISENYFGTYTVDKRHQLYSVTKSFVATLIGIASDKGTLTGTDQHIVDFFPKYKFDHLNEQKRAMTLDDTLTMRTGLDWAEGDPAYRDLFLSSDWVKFMLDKPMVTAPGTQFNYCSGCSHLLSAIVQQTTKMDPHDFADQVLFKPLGISDVKWDTDTSGTPIGGWGLWLTPRDMAKLGYLYLRHGEWDGQQIVSARWVENATRTHTATDSDLGYGYQWWTSPSLAAFMALGRYGQMICVVPELDLIIVTTAEMDNHDPIFELIQQYIVPAVQDR
ncbi:MAG: serine hydrolase [Anaerolineae bacterium]